MLSILLSRKFLYPHDCHRKRALVSPSNLRALSSATFDQAIRQFVVRLAEQQPCFPMSAKDVTILHEPSQFYKCLLDMIRRARHHLFISSLYVGSEDVELIEALRASLREKPSLKLHMLLDLNRCTRPGPTSTAHLLLPLIQEHPDRVRISLFRSPSLKGIMAKVVPPRFNEGWGTWHPKIYGADDEVLISGANLNTSYFTNRQDRYLHFTAQEHMARYCRTFIDAASTFSYSLRPSAAPQGYALHWEDRNIHPHHIESKVHQVLSTFQLSHRSMTNSPASILDVDNADSSVDKPDVLVFPIIQGGQFNIREEERTLEHLFEDMSRVEVPDSPVYNGPLIDLTSGYFGLSNKYQDLAIDSPNASRILAASPRANGFYGSKGLSGRIPEGYTFLEQQFMDAVRGAGREWISDPVSGDILNPGIQLNEWERKGWTYHAKGIWLRPTPSSHPFLTLFGSTNLNSRSADLDTELSFVLVTSSPSLRAALADEVKALRQYAHPWQGDKRHVRFGTRVLVAMTGGML